MRANYTSSPTTCITCDASTFYNETAGSIPTCLSCGVYSQGTYSNQSFFSRSTCAACEIGTYSNDTSGYDGCHRCPAHSYSITSVNYPMRGGSGNCSLCPSLTYLAGGKGIYSNETSPCLSCPASSFQVAISTECIPCRFGTYSSSALFNVTTCPSCPGGTYADTVGLTSCYACPNGTISSSGATVCLGCVAGTYRSAASTCTPCPAGSYNRLDNSTSCLSCEAGRYSLGTGSLLCTACSAGTYGRGTGLNVSCTECTDNSFSRAGAQECVACPFGFFNNATLGHGDCYGCPAATYFFNISSALVVSYMNCARCPMGRYNDQLNQTTCYSCAEGYIPNSGQTGCNPCASGAYSKAGFSSCVSCAAGEFSPPMASRCIPCSPGSVAVRSGAQNCTLCPIGRYWASSSLPCQQCKAGTFSLQGETACSSCPNGSVSVSVGTESCVDSLFVVFSCFLSCVEGKTGRETERLWGGQTRRQRAAQDRGTENTFHSFSTRKPFLVQAKHLAF